MKDMYKISMCPANTKYNKAGTERFSMYCLCRWQSFTEPLPIDRTLVCATYRKLSNISRTKSQNLNNSRLILQLSLPNPLKPGVKSRMKM